MAFKDQLKKWLDKTDSGPERTKLAERLVRDADDEETASFINRVLDRIEKGDKE